MANLKFKRTIINECDLFDAFVIACGQESYLSIG